MGLEIRPAFFIVMQEGLIEQIKNIIQPIIEEEKADLVDLIYRWEGGGQVLRVLVDKAGGVTLDDCIRINKKLGEILDKEDLIHQRFVLEVDSPGMDRPLTKRSDFLRSISKKIRLIVRSNKGATDTLTGVLKAVDTDSLVLSLADRDVEVVLADIIKARLEITL